MKWFATRREPGAVSLEAVKELYLAEKQLSGQDAEAVALLGDDGGETANGESLRLISLRECKGVNALAEGQEIVFNPRMTVLFGENASGKTGYVRVLKRLANVRSAETIIADIHRPNSSVPPQAVLRYAIGDEELDLEWHDEKGVPPFTRMTVFDSPAAVLHLEDNMTYLYTPADVALFKHVHAAIDGVRTLLENEVTTRRPRQNPFITAFARASPIYPKVESLSASTNLAELEEQARVTDTERTELEALKVSVEALSGASAEGRAEMLRSRIAVLRNLITLGEALGRFQPQDFQAAVLAESRARDDQTGAAAAVFGGGQLPNEVRPAWQAFIEAGERYLTSTGQDEYPTADDVCLYCRQALDEAARALLVTYREYASGTTAAAVTAATTQVSALQAPLTSAEVATALEMLRTMLPGIEEGEHAPDWAAEGHHLLEQIGTVREGVVGRRAVDVSDVSARSASLLPPLRIALTETETTLKALEGDSQERTTVLAEERDRVALLEARVTLSRLQPDIRAYVEQAQWADRLKTLLGRFQGLLRGLTEASKVASQDILNRDFETFFHKECETLRGPNVTLDFPGRRGQAARRKSVAPDHSIAEILSEGEQKVIAIADFLAEASLRSGSAPIIFDDPVTSFDHRRIREIAKRIASLSGEQQVVVFTHDIWFVSELLAEFEKRAPDCTYYQVDERDGFKGVVSRATNPRLDTPAQVRKRINAGIQDAASASDEDRQGRVDSVYDDVRAWCELVVERDLLGRVTQRYQPNVAMQNLESIKPAQLQAAIDVIFPIWEKANRYVRAHSQPLVTLGIRPNLDELRRDWADLQRALETYKAD